MCEFHGSNGNGFGDIWWTDNPIYFSSIDDASLLLVMQAMNDVGKIECCLHLWKLPIKYLIACTGKPQGVLCMCYFNLASVKVAMNVAPRINSIKANI